MTIARVCWNESNTDGVFADGYNNRLLYGALTDEHAASSYGQPVVVADDGAPLGTAEVRGELYPVGNYTAEQAGLLAAARQVGYRVHRGATPNA